MNVLEQRQAEAVVSIAKTLRTPDWEQRRYEIAKDVMYSLIATEGIRIGDDEKIENDVYSIDKHLIEVSLRIADELIKQLKNTPMP